MPLSTAPFGNVGRFALKNQDFALMNRIYAGGEGVSGDLVGLMFSPFIPMALGTTGAVQGEMGPWGIIGIRLYGSQSVITAVRLPVRLPLPSPLAEEYELFLYWARQGYPNGEREMQEKRQWEQERASSDAQREQWIYEQKWGSRPLDAMDREKERAAWDIEFKERERQRWPSANAFFQVDPLSQGVEPIFTKDIGQRPITKERIDAVFEEIFGRQGLDPAAPIIEEPIIIEPIIEEPIHRQRRHNIAGTGESGIQRRKR